MSRNPDDMSFQTKAAHFVANALARGLISLALALPYRNRVPIFGWVMAHLVGPLAGYRGRAKAHIAFIFPKKSPQDCKALATACLNNTGRTLIENYSARAFLDRLKGVPISGAGLGPMEEAAKAGRPVILVTGHFGNYEAVRAALVGRGYHVGGLYRDMSNPYFNAHYVRTMKAFGGPVFAQGRKGTAGFVRHLKSGGQLVLLFDQHVFAAPVLDFLGKPARTAVSAAELARRYDALLIPFYGIRQADGLTFDCVMEAPIPHGTPVEMTQAMNDSISARIRSHPDQWFWVARRWRPDSP
ncbi:MAG: lysophospholipid acyltransferase family protein [Pseudomonadota bacterium]